MASIGDVENGLVTLAAAALFPAGGYQPGASVASSTAGLNVMLSRGWPIAARLDADIAAFAAQVTISPGSGMARNTTRYPGIWKPPAVATAPTLTVAKTTTTVTFGGAGGAGQIVGVAIGLGYNPAAYAVRSGATDAPTTIAAAFAALIPGASAAGAVLTVPGPVVSARVLADQPATREVRRQQQMMQFSIWAPSASARDAITSVLDAYLGGVAFFAASDGSSVRMIYAGQVTLDPAAKAGIYRRDMRFTCEYATIQAQSLPEMMFGTLNVNVTTPDGVVLATTAATSVG